MKNLILTGMIFFCFSLVGKAQYNNNLIIEPILKTDTTSIGQKISYPSTQQAEVTMLKITIPPGNDNWLART